MCASPPSRKTWSSKPLRTNSAASVPHVQSHIGALPMNVARKHATNSTTALGKLDGFHHAQMIDRDRSMHSIKKGRG